MPDRLGRRRITRTSSLSRRSFIVRSSPEGILRQVRRIEAAAPGARHMTLAIGADSQPAHQREQAELRGSAGRKVGVTAALKAHYRRAKASREIDRLITIAPTASIRDDLMAIAARNELSA